MCEPEVSNSIIAHVVWDCTVFCLLKTSLPVLCLVIHIPHDVISSFPGFLTDQNPILCWTPSPLSHTFILIIQVAYIFLFAICCVYVDDLRYFTLWDNTTSIILHIQSWHEIVIVIVNIGKLLSICINSQP